MFRAQYEPNVTWVVVGNNLTINLSKILFKEILNIDKKKGKESFNL